MTPTSPYRLSQEVKRVYLAWWRQISDADASDTHGSDETKTKRSGTHRADRAELKRAGSLLAVACKPAYQRIYRDMKDAHKGEDWGRDQQERIAAFVALAAHVKKNNHMSLPEAMSHALKPEERDRNPVSPLRFRRLLDSPDIESLFNGLRRTLPLIDHQVDPWQLAEDVFGWSDMKKKDWAYSYKWPRNGE